MATQPTLTGPLPAALEVRPIPKGANDNEDAIAVQPAWQRYTSALPPDAQAIIEPDPYADHPGRARRGRWRLRFKERFAPSPDPLTGWTGAGDPLSSLMLEFATRGAAEAYCRGCGLSFVTHDKPRRRPVQPALQAFQLSATAPLCCWPTGPHARCCGNYPVLADPGTIQGKGTAADPHHHAGLS